MNLKLQIIALMILFCACSPQKRIQRITTRHPELLQPDTTKVIDTFIIPEIHIDTTFITGKTDTVTFYKDNVLVKIIRNNDTIRTTITKEADTIIKYIKIPTSHISINQDTKLPTWVIVVIVISVIIIVGEVIRKIKGN